ncbi:MAG: AsmA-like C-terminal region-containing protein [Vicinamibacterales bacterium]
MLKKVVLGVLALMLVGSTAVFFWARSILAHDSVRAQLAAQISEALGQPVTVGGIGAGIYPRVTVELSDVTIGDARQIHVRALHLGTDFRALLSRRIEHADVRVDGATVRLPLPTLAGTEGPTVGSGQNRSESPSYVTLVSVDEIILRNVEVVSSGRTVRADIDAVPSGGVITLRRVSLAADDTAIEATGEITSLTGPVATLALEAGELDFDRLLTFLSEFAAGAAGQAFGRGQNRPAEARASDLPSTKTNLTITIAADKARSSGLVLDKLSGTARVTSHGATLDPVGFGLFGGRYDGRLDVTLDGGVPRFEAKASLTQVDMAALAAFAGSADTISGQLSGRMDLIGSGSDLAAALDSASGRARVDLANGAIRNLNLVRNVVVATSGRADAMSRATSANAGGERFSRLGATLAIADGQARTSDLRLESPDVELNASGSLALDGRAIALAGLVQLSQALSNEAGRDLLRYAAEGGRVSVPVTLTGSLSEPAVRVDITDLTKRAIRNKAAEEVNKALQRNLGSLFKRVPK